MRQEKRYPQQANNSANFAERGARNIAKKISS
jgi:hypothetical protein